jgi:hypothetical protein
MGRELGKEIQRGPWPVRNIILGVIRQARGYLEAIGTHLQKPVDSYYRFVGALNPETKGSGLATVCAAIGVFVFTGDDPEHSIYTSANLIGSDTDTIASFVGALLGARYGRPAGRAYPFSSKEFRIKNI